MKNIMINNLTLIKYLFFLLQIIPELLRILENNYTKFNFKRYYEKS